MSDYTQINNYTAKDALPAGDPAKVIKGSEQDAELSAISTAIASKANAASPTFTGTITWTGTTVAGAATITGGNTHSGNNTFSGANTHSGNNTFTGTNSFTNTSTFTGAVELTSTFIMTSTDAGAGSAPLIKLFRDSASPAVDDSLGRIVFRGRNDAAEDVAYGGVAAQIADETDGTEDGRLVLQTNIAGTVTNKVTVTDHVEVGSPTGTVAADDINIAGKYYSNGVLVASNKELLQSGAFGAASTLDLTDIPSDYDVVELYVVGVDPVSNADLWVRLSTNNGSSFYAGATDYEWYTKADTGAGTARSGNSANDTKLNISGGVSGIQFAGSFVIRFFGLGIGARKAVTWTGGFYDAAGTWTIVQGGGGFCKNATAISSAVDAIRLLPSTGSFQASIPATQKYYLYGYKNPA